MYTDKKVAVVMPAYNAAQTLRQTYDEVMAQEIVDVVIVVDDASNDDTTAIAKRTTSSRLRLPNSVTVKRSQNIVVGTVISSDIIIIRDGTLFKRVVVLIGHPPTTVHKFGVKLFFHFT